MPTISGVDGLTFSSVQSFVAGGVQTSENKIQTLLTQNQENPSATDLIQLQTAVQQWSLAISTVSTVVKDLGDSLKGIIQRAT